MYCLNYNQCVRLLGKNGQKISAISADVNEYANSGEMDYIVMDNSECKEEVNSKLDEVLKRRTLHKIKSMLLLLV